MILIHIKSGEYPVTKEMFQTRFPRLPFPPPLPWANYGYAIVYPSSAPAVSATQYLVELQPAQNTNGTWRQKWEARDYTDAGLAEMRKKVMANAYKGVIRRRAQRFAQTGDAMGAVYQLKQIGE
jgi:hypothetical protein